ncbi:MAG: YbaB/EbfC family nucleoid-associated protein [Planctomycetales bacterium]|nr:YbaB/EbfC family nucleoid-associated protein [Planctomycetales bacterium]NIM09894.1 YbaB/EbfC family nucleoid-associated protein [Planctomycetales bacterium]NIN09333.1 YbaB/EbfC family nucleoid-associated protein [Planctomycetales bacterium]NIN78443.1 YbaB/EbfC family nucleoid-associated protein [Planctomycetales bacterium]NIO35633.1 YbaB/EbfC family nucleoid-associated protein [Planctomycetales bacterium]
MLGGMGNIANLLKQAQQMGSRMQEMRSDLQNLRTTGAAGGGLVEVEVNGLGEILRVTIDSSLIEKQDRELIEDLIPAAANQAQAKAKEKHAEAMKEMTGGLNLPGLEDALNSLADNSSSDDRPPQGPAGQT